MSNENASPSVAERVAARQRDVVDKPQRIPPLSPEEFTPEVREIVDNLQRAVGIEPNGHVPEYTATMLRYPELNQRHTHFALLLMNGVIPARDRELVVLRVGWHCQAPFEWNSHVHVGKRLAGLTSEEIDRVTRGSDDPAWNEDDRALLKAVEEMLADAMISDETWANLAKRYDYKQLLELPLLVGQYLGVAYQQNSIRATLMPGDEGLTAR